MEVLCDEFLYLVGIAFDILSEVHVVEGAELSDDAVDHGWGKYAVFLERLALLLETGGTGHAGVG